MNIREFAKTMIIILGILLLGVSIVALGVNSHVKKVGSQYLITAKEVAALSEVDCILVLGCRVKDDGTPSALLKDRLTKAIELYNLGAAAKLLMSGDHASEEYNEVGAMKRYAVNAGIPTEDIFMDHAGLSTYESLYRAKEIFKADKIVIVTQAYHMYRALYIAEKLGVEAYGIAAADQTYVGQPMRDFREVLARCKDFVISIIKPAPKFMGETVPIYGNGDLTNDWETEISR